jgi:hypothetical protein
MLIKILGAIDILGALFLFILKSLMGFFRDFASWTDFFVGLFFFFSILISLPAILLSIGAILLIQKAIVSFL